MTADNLDMHAMSLTAVMDDIGGFPTGITSFAGGGSGVMSIKSGTESTVLYTLNAFRDGMFNGDGRLIVFHNVSSITDTLMTDSRIFTFANGADNHVSLGDDDGADDKMSRLSSVNLSVTITFANPSVLLRLNSGMANDRVIVETLDQVSPSGGTFAAEVFIRGEEGNDVVDASASSNNLVIEGNQDRKSTRLNSSHT